MLPYRGTEWWICPGKGSVTVVLVPAFFLVDDVPSLTTVILEALLPAARL